MNKHERLGPEQTIRRRWVLAGLAGALSACTAVPKPVLVEAPPPPAAPPAVAVPKPPPRLPRIGLALGGGAARGFAHIGVIQVLEEAGIRPEIGRASCRERV